MSNINPTGEEIQQFEIPEYPAVRVRVETPVKVQEMPAVTWSTRRFSVANTDTPVRIMQANPRRFRAIITVRGQVAYIGDSQQSAQAQAVILAAPSSIELRHSQEVWSIGGNVAASEIGVVEEYWAE